MLTRSRSTLQLAQEKTPETKKRKVNSPADSHRSTRKVAPVDDKRKKSKLKTNLSPTVESPQSVPNDIPPKQRKNPRQPQRTGTVDKKDTDKKSNLNVALNRDAVIDEPRRIIKHGSKSSAPTTGLDANAPNSINGSTQETNPSKSRKISRKAERTDTVKTDEKQKDTKKKSNLNVALNRDTEIDESHKISQSKRVVAPNTSNDSTRGTDEILSTTKEKTDEEHTLNTCSNAIERVLASNYVNVSKRLRIISPATCLQSLVKCKEDHLRNAVSNRD